ncbi:hypothetical protein HZH66_013751 [Vespula vulgaris]|uniref:Uncharacterized protein n=1 Tax=Vespula vulgaris TaxID=7454 RepID=A0A834J699_VESVU|nr:hypothetical protein HZH66_013751 [Vespula vulgaris]
MVGRLIDVFPSANEVLAISAEEGELAKTSIPEYLDETFNRYPIGRSALTDLLISRENSVRKRAFYAANADTSQPNARDTGALKNASAKGPLLKIPPSEKERRRNPATSERLITRIAPRTLPIAAGTLSHILSRPFFSICAIHPRRICMNRRFEACSAKLLVFLRNRLEKPYGFFLQPPTFPSSREYLGRYAPDPKRQTAPLLPSAAKKRKTNDGVSDGRDSGGAAGTSAATSPDSQRQQLTAVCLQSSAPL